MGFAIYLGSVTSSVVWCCVFLITLDSGSDIMWHHVEIFLLEN